MNSELNGSKSNSKRMIKGARVGGQRLSPQGSGRQHEERQEVKARLFIFKRRTNFGHLSICSQSWAHLARAEAVQHAAAQRAENGT